MQTTRTEVDSVGPIQVPSERLWGAQTQRSLEQFTISGERMPASLISALALVKKAAALVNAELGVLDAERCRAIVQAAEEVLEGKHDQEFPLLVWQTGSGTQTNMNMNEVLANRASELLGGKRGPERLVHPNDHVNRSQSSNDVFPSAMSVAALRALHDDVVPSVTRLANTFASKAKDFTEVVKIGRTHLMDATPLTLGQELGAFAAQLRQGVLHLQSAVPHLSELALGGTAVGTGLNAPPGYAGQVAQRLSELSGFTLTSAPNKFEALAAHDALVFAHGALKTLATSLIKIGNDIRWLSSGPRSGIGEVLLPENEPGSSIMPGKVNPTQAEALLMACMQVVGNDVAVSLAGSSGNFQLNVAKPLIIHDILWSCRLLADGCDSFERLCIRGLEANEPRIAHNLQQSLMLVTALTRHIGYDKAAKIAQRAHESGKTLREAAVELGTVSAEDFDAWVSPRDMLGT